MSHKLLIGALLVLIAYFPAASARLTQTVTVPGQICVKCPRCDVDGDGDIDVDDVILVYQHQFTNDLRYDVDNDGDVDIDDVTMVYQHQYQNPNPCPP